MNKPSILKSVSVSEMLHLREVEGLTNREIANKIGCSYPSYFFDYTPQNIFENGGEST